MTNTACNKKHMSGDGPCPYMRECGGCEWLGLPYHKQLMRKHEAMTELFTPLLTKFGWDVSIGSVLGMGQEDAFEPVVVQPGKKMRFSSPRGFRHKAASPYTPTQTGDISSGFYKRGTHIIMPCPACVVEAPGCRELLNKVAEIATRLGIPAYVEDAHTGELRHAIVRAGWQSNELMLTLVTRSGHVQKLDELSRMLMQYEPRLCTVAHNINPRSTNAILGGETRILAGAGYMRDGLLGCTFEISPTSFYQVNPQQTEVLYKTAIEYMDLRPEDTLFDTYCGSGTIGLCAARYMQAQDVNINLIGVERNAQGIHDAKRNAMLNGLLDEEQSDESKIRTSTPSSSAVSSPSNSSPSQNIQFITQDATLYMQRAAEQHKCIDVLVLDPPRAGSTPEFIQAAATLAPRRIVYISCNPITQVRDLEQFGRLGYKLEHLTPVDMFPHTTHVETVACLARS